MIEEEKNNKLLWIEDDETLKAFCHSLSKVTYLSIDTEFIRERTYYPELCLIQIESEGKIALIDALAPLDLTPLKNLLLSPHILKIFHAARQDLEIFYYLWKKIPNPLYDTQIAAMFCGFGESISYQNLVMALLQKEIDKTEQHTNWKLRPLRKKQIHYAAADVAHLRSLQQLLDEKAEDKKKWIYEESTYLTHEKIFESSDEGTWSRFKKPNNFSGEELYILRGLVIWRDHYARAHNLAKTRVIANEDLPTLAKKMPQTAEDLEALSFFRKKQIDVRQEEILGLLKTLSNDLQKTPTLALNVITRRDEQNTHRLLKVLLIETAAENNISDTLIATQRDLQSFITTQNAPFLHGWRDEVFGKRAQLLMEGKLSLAIEKGKITPR